MSKSSLTIFVNMVKSWGGLKKLSFRKGLNKAMESHNVPLGGDGVYQMMVIAEEGGQSVDCKIVSAFT